VQVSGLTEVVEVAAGMMTAYARKSDGTVWAWGSNPYGAIGDGTTTVRTTPVQVKNVAGTGYLSNVTAIAAGGWTAYAIDASGQAYAWGNGSEGEFGNNTEWPEGACCPVSSSLPIEAHGPDTHVLKSTAV
jgi:alpha-tubulin suppressor-like RCC1 family protein